MQAIDLLLQRRSARALTEPAPDADTLRLLLAAAARAPDHGRLRPWRFIVIRGAGRERLGELLAAHARRLHPAASEESLARERAKALRAPLVLVVAAQCQTEVKVPRLEQELSAACAAHAIMLAAVALGFNAMWKTGGAAYDAQVKEALGLAAEDALIGFIYLGTEPAPARDTALRVPEDRLREWP
ncbi:MAG: nitroreductase family protein [Gammaproteobacteria bacterium]|nr:nitroreductase family protein [Gammaproteobacteria bacterium]MBV9619491.1 nitroreductase family protein [Gammaproteobacteria bacterium]